jgi:hypothetical protein
MTEHRPVVAKRKSDTIWSERSNTGGMPITPSSKLFDIKSPSSRASSEEANYALRKQLKSQTGGYGAGPGGTRSDDVQQKPHSPECVRL